jgi:hypothetical protein
MVEFNRVRSDPSEYHVMAGSRCCVLDIEDDPETGKQARVEALARRSATVAKETVLQVGDLKLDLLSRTVSRGNSKFSIIWLEMRATSFRGQCCCSMYGICISSPRPMSSTSMSGASAARSTISKPTRSSTLYEVSGFVSVLRARSSGEVDAKVVAFCVGVIGALVPGR